MYFRITATELARELEDVLARIRYRSEVVVVERKGQPIARITPAALANAEALGEGLRAWCAAGSVDVGFADDLERVNLADRPLSLR